MSHAAQPAKHFVRSAAEDRSMGMQPVVEAVGTFDDTHLCQLAYAIDRGDTQLVDELTDTIETGDIAPISVLFEAVVTLELRRRGYTLSGDRGALEIIDTAENPVDYEGPQ